MNVIDTLDLEPIKVKLMHKESGEGWTLEHASAVEAEYRRFLYLMKTFPQEQAAPLIDVDTFWHYHILDTLKYAEDCQDVFGHFLHHFPYIVLRGADDLAAHERLGLRMQQLYEATFGMAYPVLLGTSAQPAKGSAYSAVAAQTAYSPGAAQTAYSAVSSRSAYSAVAAGTAYSAVATQTAYSAVGQRTAYSAVSTGAAATSSSLFTERPRLARAA